MQLIKIEEDEDQLINDKTVNFCDGMYGSGNQTGIIDHTMLMDLTFTGIIQACPYSEIKVSNGSRIHSNNALAIGNYKTITTIMDDSDDKVFEVIYFEDLKPRAWLVMYEAEVVLSLPP